MKVRAWVSIEQEVTVDVSMEDIRATLSKDGDTTGAALQLLSRCASCMKAISDDMIGGMNNAQREVVVNFLQEQAARYMPNSLMGG
jgi:hypothetical protein